MKNNDSKSPIDVYIKIVVLSLLMLWSLLIIRPFVTLIVWAIILAVTLYPLQQKLLRITKGKKEGLVTSLFILVLIAVITLPTISLAGSILDSSKEVYRNFEEGTLKLPPPSEAVKDWPMIGSRIYDTWSSASRDMEIFMVNYKDQISESLSWFFRSITGLMGAVLLGLVSLIIAGVFMSAADSGYRSGVRFANKLIPGRGDEFMKMCADTIRSVVKGILLVAVIQAVLAYFGFVLVGLPAAGLFALLVLILAIVQIPALLAMIPAIGIVFSYADTTAAVVFTIYVILVSLSDNLLKPMLLGKGLNTPMLVILIGALGGMMLNGILGLFIGPVVLALLYQLYTVWVAETSNA